ncbi:MULTISPECIES: SDR family oxidoreductase [Rhodomicrobium]|uniref:SDR family NAD(P)-dependent oxidoreductase n=1 Tax=Rhodomicrobium TaxID=1068 RepID=UPI000B4B4209|nr:MULTISPECIES: SDR family oxidoreductase [Rhodomicrobium]
MIIDLSGKTAIVSASTLGIGYAIAKGLGESGATVVVNGRKQGAVDKALAALADEVAGGKFRGFAADLATAEGCAALVAAEPSADILVNNLGVYGPQDFFEIPDSEWQRYFDTNIMSGIRLARAYAPGMVERGWGRIIFLSSESGLNIPADMIHYGLTKTANLSVSRGLAKRLAGTGVTVNAVLPGPTITEGVIGMLKEDTERLGSVEAAGEAFVLTNRPSTIIRRMATAEEVANLVVYTASPQASATTGAALRVDGGVVDSL